jgi:hypothetical protein
VEKGFYFEFEAKGKSRWSISANTHGEAGRDRGGPPPPEAKGGTHRLEVVGGAEDPEAVLPRRRRLRRRHAILHLPASTYRGLVSLVVDKWHAFMSTSG